jgi:uncharacterized protein (TIGR01370 family)
MLAGVADSSAQSKPEDAPAGVNAQHTEASGSYSPSPRSGDPVGGPAEKENGELPATAAWRGFGVQYWGDSYTPAQLAEAPHSRLIIEPSRLGADISRTCREEQFTRDEIRLMGRDGTRPVVGYLNVGELARYRDYWRSETGGACGKGALSAWNKTGQGEPGTPETAAWYGAPYGAEELLSAFWTDEWQQILRGRVDDLLRLGFDGVFLDDILHYYHWGTDARLREASAELDGPANIGAMARAMMHLVIDIADYARGGAPNADPDFQVIVNGAPYIGWDASAGKASRDTEIEALYGDYLDSIDAILVENALSRENIASIAEVLRKEYLRRGKPVLSVDYWSAAEAPADFDRFRERIAAAARENGFAAYVAADGLFDRLYPPLAPSPTETRADRDDEDAADTGSASDSSR